MCKSLFFGVRSGETYECKVDGVCEDGTISSTLVHTVTLPSEDTSRQRNCGVLPPVDLSVTEPLEGVLPGDFFGPATFRSRSLPAPAGMEYSAERGMWWFLFCFFSVLLFVSIMS